MDYLYHHGIKGQKWGVRRYQNEDGSLTQAGTKRYKSQLPEGYSKNRNIKAVKIGLALAGGAIAAYGAYRLSGIVNEAHNNYLIDEGNRALQSILKSRDEETREYRGRLEVAKLFSNSAINENGLTAINRKYNDMMKESIKKYRHKRETINPIERIKNATLYYKNRNSR